MTQTAKHTPVRIKALFSGQSACLCLVDEHGEWIKGKHTSIHLPRTGGKDHPNAQLVLAMAVAPETAAERDRLKELNAELLAALKVALQALQITGYESRLHQEALEKTRAAIAKAEGR